VRFRALFAGQGAGGANSATRARTADRPTSHEAHGGGASCYRGRWALMPTALIFAGPAHSYFYSTRTRTCKVRLGWAKVGPRRCQNVPETCMLVDGAYGNTMQQNNGQTSQKRNLKRYITFVFEWYAFSRAFLWGWGAQLLGDQEAGGGSDDVTTRARRRRV
jgi:hypothetical protein